MADGHSVGVLERWLRWWCRLRAGAREITRRPEPFPAEPGREGEPFALGGLGEHLLVLGRHADAEGLFLGPLRLAPWHVDTP